MFVSFLVAAALLAPAQQQLSLQPYASGLGALTGISSTAAEPNRLYAVEQVGRIRYLINGRVRGTLIDLRDRVLSGGEQGLLSVAFHPNYKRNRRFYVNYTDKQGNTLVVEFRSRNGRGLKSTARQLLFVRQPYANHNGGELQFGRRSGQPRAEPGTAARQAAAHQPAQAWRALADGRTRPAQPMALLVRPCERGAGDRRRRPGQLGGDRLPAGCGGRHAGQLRLEGVRGPRALLEHAARARAARYACERLQPRRQQLLGDWGLRLSWARRHRGGRAVLLRGLLLRNRVEPAHRERKCGRRP